MAVKTLSSFQPLVAPSSAPRQLTYSLAPTAASVTRPQLYANPAELESFLEAENPLGCMRGVMWVMAFNGAVFLLCLAVWQSLKHLL